jgi:hypothetical protein
MKLELSDGFFIELYIRVPPKPEELTTGCTSINNLFINNSFTDMDIWHSIDEVNLKDSTK